MKHESRKGRVAGVAGWLALALLGLAVAAAVSLAASRLSSQHIGLSSEPLTAGQSLTPVENSSSHTTARPHRTTRHGSGKTSTTTTTTRTTPSPVAPAPVTPRPVQPAPRPVQTSRTTQHHSDDSGKDNSGGHGRDD
jgi:hypothetical protein